MKHKDLSASAKRQCGGWKTGSQKLSTLLAKLPRSLRWDLKKTFTQIWKDKPVLRALGLLDAWCERAMRSRLQPMKKKTGMLRNQERLLLNWFRARGELPSAAVEGLNNKVRAADGRS